MTKWREIGARKYNRKDYAELSKRPNAAQIIERQTKQIFSSRPLRDIGHDATFGPATLSEEERESHIHIIGTTGEGKSKLLEMFLQQDIDNGYGACLIDPSVHGETAYNVLRYAIKKRYKKVVFIDPHDFVFYDKVPCINPIHYHDQPSAMVGHLMDTMRVLWGRKSFTETPRIEKYLPAVLTALYCSKMTLPDAECFLNKDEPAFAGQRAQILSHDSFIEHHLLHRANIYSALKNQREWDGFLPTVNSLMPFMDPMMKLMFGSVEGMDFCRLVADGWLILVNLDPRGIFSQQQQQLLGTVVINEIIDAVERLGAEHPGKTAWKGRYYLYIDEVGDYATRKIAEVMDKKRKTGLSITMAHQRPLQLPEEIRESIETGGKIKILFNTPSRSARDWMLRMMYSGALSEDDTTRAASQLKKQFAFIKINKQDTKMVRLKDINTPKDVSIKDIERFKKSIIYSQPWYKPPATIREGRNQRFHANGSTSQPGGTHSGQRTQTRNPKGNQKEPDRNNKASVVQNAPAGQQRRDPGVPGAVKLPEIKRKKGIPSTLVPKRPLDDK